MNGHVCHLEDGRRIKFSLKRRERDPFYLVSFRGPAGKRLERSTKEENIKRAIDAAVAVIRQEYSSKPHLNKITWDEAIELLAEKMRGENLRQGTISDYEINVGNLRKMFPKTNGQGEITSQMAETFKSRRKDAGKSIHTVKNDLISLKVIYGKWWGKVGEVLNTNPFAKVNTPKIDKQTPRLIMPHEQAAFLTWLSNRWNGWRFPILFLEVKALVGCRISELACSPTTGLTEGRIQFEAETTKGRKERSVKVPQEIFEELEKIAGTTFVFEEFAQQLRGVHIKRGKPHHARCVGSYAPHKLKAWLEREAHDYFVENPQAKKFKLHNFRGTAMSKACNAGVSYDDASIAFGCHPETMRQYYLVLDEIKISDRVMDQIQAQKSGEKNGEIAPTEPQKPTEGDAA